MVKKVLITGGAGFLGSHVTDRAMREGYDVTVMDNLYTGRMENLEHHIGHPRFHFVNHDVKHPFPDKINAIKFDFIFHLACAASPVHYQSDPIGTTLTCVNGTLHALDAALRSDCPILISSTSEVYGDPQVNPQPETYWGNTNCTGIRSCYDEGKRCAEALCFDYHRKYGYKVRVARIFNTYGPRMCFNDGRIISNFLVQALRGDDITVYGTGEYTRSFQFYEDLIEGFWRLIMHPTETGPVNLGNPEEYSVLEMAEKAKELVPGTKSKIVFLEAASDDPKQRRPDNTKANKVLGWKPQVSLAVGLRRTVDEFASRLARDSSALPKIYVQCNPLLDISSHVDADFLKKYDIQPASAALFSDKQEGIYADIESRADHVFIPGGSGLNTARVAQWLAQAPKRSLVSYVGCVADDKYGSILKESAEKEGVVMNVEYTTKAPTGSCAVCITGKERSLVANLAAANCLTGAHLETPEVQKALKESKLFYLSGFTLTVSVDYVLTVAKKAHQVGGKFMLNLSAPFIVQFFGEQLNKVLPYVDVLFGNEEEAKAFAEANKLGTTSIAEIAQKAAAMSYSGPHSSRLVVFTQGPQPSAWATTSSNGEVAVKPIDSSKIIDTNGAGDAFVGGFLAGLAHGAEVTKCIEAGNYAAGVVIQHDGCTFPETPEFKF
jgi:nucleoside-diphosphate-sugar epimerase/sugar/nucleoside kinase (ribokinase family)